MASPSSPYLHMKSWFEENKDGDISSNYQSLGNGGLERQSRSRLVSRMRRLWCAGRAPEGTGRVADTKPQRGDYQRYRLFVKPPRIHQYLRHAHSARSGSGCSHWSEACESRTDRTGDWR